jgi:Glyoxalase-like domain
MLTRIDLTLDCANPQLLAAFWKTAAGYVDEPPPTPFATREEWLSQFDAEFDDGMDATWLHDPTSVAPRLSLLQVPEPKTAKNRLHLDRVRLPWRDVRQPSGSPRWRSESGGPAGVPC